MTEPPLLVAFLAAAYLFGAIPFGLLLAKAVGIDVRGAGSGNIGATNVARTAGKGLGVATLVLDALKGATPVLIAQHLLGAPTWVEVAGGLAAIAGHVFPVYLRFKGGKGVATALGVFVTLTPAAAGAAVLTFGVVFALFRMVSLGSLVAALALIAASVYLDGRLEVISAAALVSGLVFVRHTGNIRRMVSKTESKM